MKARDPNSLPSRVERWLQRGPATCFEIAEGLGESSNRVSSALWVLCQAGEAHIADESDPRDKVYAPGPLNGKRATKVAHKKNLTPPPHARGYRGWGAT